jgi:hypothetical protein
VLSLFPVTLYLVVVTTSLIGTLEVHNNLEGVKTMTSQEAADFNAAH